MVSRQETARPLLTAGEIMQLPTSDEIVLVSGCPPIRAKKVRYYKDPRLKDRILPPPQIGQTKPTAPSDPPQTSQPWSKAIVSPDLKAKSDPANGGPRRELELPEHEHIVPEPGRERPEFEFGNDADDVPAPAQLEFDELARTAIRQTALDPGDDLGM